MKETSKLDRFKTHQLDIETAAKQIGGVAITISASRNTATSGADNDCTRWECDHPPEEDTTME